MPSPKTGALTYSVNDVVNELELVFAEGAFEREGAPEGLLERLGAKLGCSLGPELGS